MHYQKQTFSSKTDFLFKNNQTLRQKLQINDDLLLNDATFEAIAQQLLLLGLRYEYLCEALPLDKVRLKSIQRNLEKKGLLNGVVHTKRTLNQPIRKLSYENRIAIAIFFFIYEGFFDGDISEQINLLYFTLAFFFTKDLFVHPILSRLKIESLSIDDAFCFCKELTKGNVRYFFCPNCSQVFPTFEFETNTQCPFCKLISSSKTDENSNDWDLLKKRLSVNIVADE